MTLGGSRIAGIAGIAGMMVTTTLGGLLPAAPSAGQPAAESTDRAAGPPAIRVEGNQLVDGADEPFRMLGVNRDYSELGCVPAIWWDAPVQTFDGPVDQASVDAMLSWHVNTVRIPLNADCWLGINHTKLPASTYRHDILDYVDLLGRNGIVSVLDLHLVSPGGIRSTYDLYPLPDARNTRRFWHSVATKVGERSGVVLDLFNEPYGVSWGCWRDGCYLNAKRIRHAEQWCDCHLASGPYQAIGMKGMLAAVRGAGFAGPVMLSGTEYGGTLTKWLQYRPPGDDQLIASAHNYFGGCADVECWTAAYLPTAAEVPFVNGEVGQHGCTHEHLDAYLPFADEHGFSYLGWTWSADREKCGRGPVLIEDYDGTPTDYGIGFRDHLLSLG